MRLVLVLALGCSHRATLTSCDDDLAGPWRDPAGHRWMILDERRTLEVFPIFPDGDPTTPADVIAAPRVIDLARAPGGALTGTVHRRYSRRGDTCDARAPIQITACRDDALDLVIADPMPPASLAPCANSASPSRVERWQRD